MARPESHTTALVTVSPEGTDDAYTVLMTDADFSHVEYTADERMEGSRKVTDHYETRYNDADEVVYRSKNGEVLEDETEDEDKDTGKDGDDAGKADGDSDRPNDNAPKPAWIAYALKVSRERGENPPLSRQQALAATRPELMKRYG
jgi:hypothetical protein